MPPDVLIVGAGPAGAVLGGLLARAGRQVLLLEQARHPRPKPCGECLNPGALAVLERLGIPHDGALPLRGWRLVVGGAGATDLDFPAGLSAAAVDRRRFDHGLMQWAAAQGARVEEGVRVTDLLRGDDGRVAGARAGRHGFPAGTTVGADGLRSVVARRLGVAQSGPSEPKVAFTAHWEGIGDLTDRGEMYIHGKAVCGIAPLGQGQANVVLVVPAAAARGLTQEGALARWPGLRERLHGARRVSRVLATGPFDQPVTAAVAPGALLVGDAAGYFDPFTGQGIYRALRSAELAAEALLHGQSYQLNEFTKAERRQRYVDALVRRPAALQAGLWCLGRWPAAGRRILGLLGDCQT